jgi:hypothetical protein
MEITARALWTLIHGMGFGALYLLACSGALVELYRFTTSSAPSESTPARNASSSLPRRDGCPRMGRRADRSLCHLPVVSRCASAGDDRSCDVSATAADVESHNYRLALAWDGMEGARRLVRSHLDHDGRVRLHQVWPRPQEPSAASRCGALLCRGFVCCGGDRGLLRRDD